MYSWQYSHDKRGVGKIVSQRAIALARRAFNRFKVVISLMVINHILAGLAFSYIEGKTIEDGQWWATVTGFTVGYGDLYPSTSEGRMLGMYYIFSMFTLAAIFIAHIVSFLVVDKNMFSHKEQEKMEAGLLMLLKERGIVSKDTTEMPPTTWWSKEYGFQEDEGFE